ncbi:hypothetical protein FisN_4Lh320 [Fistulifera solaris]|uniref:Uncharacterized protein n=1 Tax=Fistulifera solaris TaxID=1519565 RepID=A0A1Z5KDL0_FISSO|nr:hypothetical protein FisN_4Lh320 [Fistulifera solaris]|eukprot:GAX24225.1 hypothetical protein FisN_4Lh320 [Fistulifera solaris]
MVWCCDPLEPILSDFETIQVDEFDKKTVVATVPSSELIVSVTIPPGVNENDTLTVRSPDGNETVTAIVPMGLSEGDTFLVRFPSNTSTSLPIADGVRPERVQPESQGGNNAISSKETEPEQLNDLSSDEGSLEEDEKLTTSVEEQLYNEDKPLGCTQKLLLVHVPEGVRPGSTIHVEIPGEFRTVAAKIPAGVTSFHVAYTPTITQKEEFQSPYIPHHLPQRASPPQQAPSTLVNKSTPSGQKLLLVQIPPGATAGTTLHVSVPDEPGRILAAKVPLGCISEFHVAYEARPPTQSRSMLAPASAYNPDQSLLPVSLHRQGAGETKEGLQP